MDDEHENSSESMSKRPKSPTLTVGSVVESKEDDTPMEADAEAHESPKSKSKSIISDDRVSSTSDEPSNFSDCVEDDNFVLRTLSTSSSPSSGSSSTYVIEASKELEYTPMDADEESPNIPNEFNCTPIKNNSNTSDGGGMFSKTDELGGDEPCFKKPMTSESPCVDKVSEESNLSSTPSLLNLDISDSGFGAACNVTTGTGSSTAAGTSVLAEVGSSDVGDEFIVIENNRSMRPLRSRMRSYRRNTSSPLNDTDGAAAGTSSNPVQIGNSDESHSSASQRCPNRSTTTGGSLSTSQVSRIALLDISSTSSESSALVDDVIEANNVSESHSDAGSVDSFVLYSNSGRSSSSDAADSIILHSNSGRSSSNGSDMDLDPLGNDNDDDDDDDDVPGSNGNELDMITLSDVMNKPKPNYTWNSTYELRRREHGLTGSGFNARFYSSRHVVERMKLSHCLRKHNGCVNCLNFNRSGDLLCTGSDDMRIIVWDWAQNKPKHVFKSGHTENIFQAKFIDSMGCLDIVSASRDGQVRRSVIPPSGGKVQSSCLYKHRGSVHKIVVCPQSHFEIISVGEDGFIRHHDLRCDNSAFDMLKVVVSGTKKNRKVRLFSISHHPFAPEICVCGCDNFVRVYDKRNMKQTVHEMCPEHLVDASIPQVTCAVYNSTGSEILSSYSDEHIYLTNNKAYKAGEYLHRYRGHYNHKTIKGVNFFGPNSEYVISGSDCGNIFFWDKNTEAILNFMPGDTMGVVNCLEPHPSIPVLATSGLDHNIKIWTPSSENYPPDLSKLETCVRGNLRRSVVDEPNVYDDRQLHYFIRQFLRRPHSHDDSNDDDDSNSNVTDAQMWSSSSSSSSSSEDEYPPLEGINCRTQ